MITNKGAAALIAHGGNATLVHPILSTQDGS
jgi:hypothetical protein